MTQKPKTKPLLIFYLLSIHVLCYDWLIDIVTPLNVLH
jgi:hypothetical protein